MAGGKEGNRHVDLDRSLTGADFLLRSARRSGVEEDLLKEDASPEALVQQLKAGMRRRRSAGGLAVSSISSSVG